MTSPSAVYDPQRPRISPGYQRRRFFAEWRDGDITLRVRCTLWLEVEPEGFELGDWVEVLSRGLHNEPRTGIIREMLWDQRSNVIRYLIADNNVPINEPYTRDDLQHVQPTDPLDRI